MLLPLKAIAIVGRAITLERELSKKKQRTDNKIINILHMIDEMIDFYDFICK